MQAGIRRPLFITILCVIGFIWVVLSFPAVFSPEVKRRSVFLPALYGVFIAAHFISLIGVWHMKRWGVNWFTAVFFLKTMIGILNADVAPLGTFLSVVFIVCFLFFYKRMDGNL